jgi:hypothetical protein
MKPTTSLSDLKKIWDEAVKANRLPNRRFGGEEFACTMSEFFKQFPQTVNPHTLKSIIVAHLTERDLQEIRNLKGALGMEAQLNFETIIPFALYWFYRQALRIPSTEPPAIRQLNALETALQCLDEYILQLIKRTELMLQRASEEAMFFAFEQEPAFKQMAQKWRKSTERNYRIALKRGHPLTREISVRRALELKSANPKLSLMQLAQKVCNCGKKVHDLSCRENLRQGIKTMKKKMKAKGGF